mgnify:CR=1 FL=1
MCDLSVRRVRCFRPDTLAYGIAATRGLIGALLALGGNSLFEFLFLKSKCDSIKGATGVFDKFKFVWKRFTAKVDGNLAKDEGTDWNELDRARARLAPALSPDSARGRVDPSNYLGGRPFSFLAMTVTIDDGAPIDVLLRYKPVGDSLTDTAFSLELTTAGDKNLARAYGLWLRGLLEGTSGFLTDRFDRKFYDDVTSFIGDEVRHLLGAHKVSHSRRPGKLASHRYAGRRGGRAYSHVLALISLQRELCSSPMAAGKTLRRMSKDTDHPAEVRTELARLAAVRRRQRGRHVHQVIARVVESDVDVVHAALVLRLRNRRRVCLLAIQW